MNNQQFQQVEAAYQAEQDYFSGKLSKESYFQKVGALLECSQPFGEGGEYVCPVCLAKQTGVDSSEVFQYLDQKQGKFQPTGEYSPETDPFQEVK